MNLNYSDEQNMLRDQVLKFCETNYDFTDREKILDSDVGYSPENWKQFAELGWLAVPFSEDNGGFNFGPIELTVMFEEFGKSLVVEPYLSSVVMSGTILENSNYAAKQELLESIIAGEQHVSVAYAEANIGYNFLDCVTTLDGQGNELTLNGSKTIVLNATNSSQFIVLAKHADSLALVLINKDTSGLEIQNFKTLDGQTCGELTFENLSLTADAVIASGEEAIALFNQMIEVATLCISAEAVGAMTASYQKTVQYTKEREQFSQPISNFQVLQHRMVDMFIETEITKSLLIKATLQLDSNDSEATKTISALKVQVGKAGKFIGQQAVQLHGGMGVSNEMSIGHYLKRFTVIDSMFGNTQHHINKYSTL
tara:strand:+ start:1165 stop:2271 length:1107 start_codon:yes stop_codon:yes gene_type:complete